MAKFKPIDGGCAEENNENVNPGVPLTPVFKGVCVQPKATISLPESDNATDTRSICAVAGKGDFDDRKWDFEDQEDGEFGINGVELVELLFPDALAIMVATIGATMPIDCYSHG